MDLDNAEDYEQFRDDNSPFHSEKYKKIFQIIPKDNKWKVLELGCGTATYTKLLVSDFNDITAIDLDEKFLDYARKKLPSVDFKKMSVLDLKFPDESFDFILGVSILHHVKKKEYLKFFQEASRVLKRGGYFALCEPHKLNPLSLGFQILQREKAISRREVRNLAQQTGFNLLYSSGILFRSNGNLILPFEKFVEKLGLGVTLLSVMKKE